ncbi:hypothetical protein [Flavobacterium geliluteum]|uniref:Uncharacterized protein n=1 Tax=Flavobacterium geliluteum TaxID=2816120 RepID=A0A940XAY0_9FLAO|nr:hypothetical protein [Flavobacterium geliluteum]MBP4139981.1 hypothetical protein [Flavobacterium geliluteum]
MTVLVIYEKWICAPHALLNDYLEKRSEIVEVAKLIDLNEKYSRILDVKILEK